MCHHMRGGGGGVEGLRDSHSDDACSRGQAYIWVVGHGEVKHGLCCRPIHPQSLCVVCLGCI